MISLTMSREDWRTGSIPELPLLRKQKFKNRKENKMEKEKRSLVKTLGWGVIGGIIVGLIYIIFH